MTNRAHENVDEAHEQLDSLELDKETLKDLEPDDKSANAKGGLLPTATVEPTFYCMPRSLLLCITTR